MSGTADLSPEAWRRTSHAWKPWLRAAVIGLIGALIAWRVIVLGWAEHHVASDQPESALALLADHPAALEARAVAMIKAGRDPEAALEILKRALAGNPARGPGYALVAALWAERGELDQAAAALAAAVRMAPAKVDIRLAAAALALQQGDLRAALEHWDVALTRRGSLRKTLYPALLELAGQPEYRAVLGQLVNARQLAWWPGFVVHASTHAKPLDTLMALYSIASASTDNRLSGAALNAVLQRLQREGLWFDARLAWMDSLSDEQLYGMGNVYNGSFEYSITGVGFDWQNARAGYVLVETAPTVGSSGDKALHVLFRGPRVRYRHLSQLLALPAGEYTLRGRVRADGLEASPGLIWAITCRGKKEYRIGQTGHFSGRSVWRAFETRFSVPAENCPAQILRLQLDGRVALDFEAKGSIWFDDIRIERSTERLTVK
jgi:tetratricopeptide (TPR) repeat protein